MVGEAERPAQGSSEGFLERAERMMVMQDELRDRIIRDRNLPEKELLKHAEDLATDLSTSSFEKRMARAIVRRYCLQRERIGEFMQLEGGVPRAFIENVFGFTPDGDVEITPRIASVHITFRDWDDFEEFKRRISTAGRPLSPEVSAIAAGGRLENTFSGRDIPGGLLTFSGWHPDASGDDEEVVQMNYQKHEEEHQIQLLIMDVIYRQFEKRAQEKYERLAWGLLAHPHEHEKGQEKQLGEILQHLREWNMDRHIAEEIIGWIAGPQENPIAYDVRWGYLPGWKENFKNVIRYSFAEMQSHMAPDALRVDVDRLIELGMKDLEEKVGNALDAISIAFSPRMRLQRQKVISLLCVTPFPEWKQTVQRITARWQARKARN